MLRLPTLVPTDFLFRSALLLVIYIGLTIFWFTGSDHPLDNTEFYKGILYSLLIVIPASLFDLYLRRGYKVCYDETAVYWRKVGFGKGLSNPIVMPYAAISHVFGEPGTLGMKPFEAVVLRSEEQEIPDVILSRMYLRNGDIKSILQKAYNTSDAMFEQEVKNFMNS